MLMMIYSLSQGKCKAGWAVGAGKFPPPHVVTPLDRGRLPSAASLVLSHCRSINPRTPRCQSQVISISRPPMRSAAALVVHQRFRTAQRGSVRRFICRLQFGCGEAMLELWAWRKTIWITTTWRTKPSTSISPKIRWVSTRRVFAVNETVWHQVFLFFFLRVLCARQRGALMTIVTLHGQARA